eukprot:gnl/Chilomastix_cuspidata/1642.p2 GENE.gnl/Chilomastix_cuspidata/1642~~gnl/Chilomastix_cuspidata/1642.p2  ORF type:complete len:259 (+),score=125.03 gnl/Chilomastix_cuspidata/1642:640-1416(+)
MDGGSLIFDPTVRKGHTKRRRKKTSHKHKHAKEAAPEQRPEPVAPAPAPVEEPAVPVPAVRHVSGLFNFRVITRKFKRARPTPPPAGEVFPEHVQSGQQNEFPWLDSDRDYEYEEMLALIRGQGGRRRKADSATRADLFDSITPKVFKRGGKHTVLSNFRAICDNMNRNVEHVKTYLLNELNTVGSLDASNRLQVVGRFGSRDFMKPLKDYVVTYVECYQCGSVDTRLVKSVHGKKTSFEVHCRTCTALKSVNRLTTK